MFVQMIFLNKWPIFLLQKQVKMQKKNPKTVLKY